MSWKEFDIRGEVTYRSAPTVIKAKEEGQDFHSGYFTVKCLTPTRLKDGSIKNVEDFFCIHTFKYSELVKMREGFMITCKISREGRLWVKGGEIQTKADIRDYKDGNPPVNYGVKQNVFDSYKLISNITVEDNTNNKEEIKEVNDGFEADMDLNKPGNQLPF